METLSKTLASIFLITLFQGCDENIVQQTTQDEKTIEVQKSAPEILKVEKNLISKKEYNLKTIENGSYKVVKEGTNFNVTNSNSSLVLFDFFTTWCPACRTVAPHLA